MRIYTPTIQKSGEEHLRLREERIKIERRPVNRPLESPPGQAFRDQTIELTESAQEAVVEKQARIAEEVVVAKAVRDGTRRFRHGPSRRSRDGTHRCRPGIRHDGAGVPTALPAYV